MAKTVEEQRQQEELKDSAARESQTEQSDTPDSVTEGSLEKMKRKIAIMSWLDSAMLVCVALMAVGFVADIVYGRWLDAATGAVWLYVAFMYWRQKRLGTEVTKSMLSLFLEMLRLKRIIRCYEEMVEAYKKKEECYEQYIKKTEEMIRKYECYIQNIEKMLKEKDGGKDYTEASVH